MSRITLKQREASLFLLALLKRGSEIDFLITSMIHIFPGKTKIQVIIARVIFRVVDQETSLSKVDIC